MTWARSQSAENNDLTLNQYDITCPKFPGRISAKKGEIMPVPDVKEKWSAEVVSVVIGATKAEGGTREKTITVGGAKTIPFIKYEGARPPAGDRHGRARTSRRPNGPRRCSRRWATASATRPNGPRPPSENSAPTSSASSSTVAIPTRAIVPSRTPWPRSSASATPSAAR